MAKKVRDATLDSRTARAKLEPAGKPYFRALDEGLHLGYRKGKRKDRSGKWVARFYAGNQHYKVETIALADDLSDADGQDVLTFNQAQTKARELLAQANREGAEPVEPGKYRVRDAMADYLDYLQHNSKSLENAKYRIDSTILPELGDIECRKLTAKRLRDWLKKLSTTPPRKRTAKGQASAHGAFDPNDPEQVRQRKASANRTLTILKAALNHAYREGKVASDAAWRRVQPFREADAARLRYLAKDEITRLLNASPPDLRRLLNAALYTGARYGELAALRVRDFHADAGTVFVAASKAGTSRHVVLTDAGQKFFSQITAGRAPDEYLLTKQDGGAWLKSHQSRPLKAACEAGRIDPPASFHTIRHSYASHCVMAGIPLMVVARNLGHSDTRMVEKHYGHLAPSYVASTIRQLAPDLGQNDESNVERLGAR